MTDTTQAILGENDALSLEDKLAYRNAGRQVDISHFVGDSALARFLSPEVDHFEEELVYVLGAQGGMAHHDFGDQ